MVRTELGTFARVDLTGVKSGRLTCLRRVGRDKWGYSLWECQCDCGNLTVKPSQRLKNGVAKSCGCFKGGRPALPDGEASFNTLLSAYRRSAKDRGISFHLTREQCAVLFKGNCYYCGVSPVSFARANGPSHKYSWGTVYNYNGIDRKDPSIHYVDGNCVSCCKHCNFAKGTLTDTQFVALAKMIATRFP